MTEFELVCPTCLGQVTLDRLYACQCGFQTATLADLVESGKTRLRQTWRVVGMTKRDGLKGRGTAVEFRSKK